MGLKAKPQPTELDHIRDTLTDMVATVGETRQNLKQLDKKVEKGFTEVRADIARLQADNTELKKRIWGQVLHLGIWGQVLHLAV